MNSLAQELHAVRESINPLIEHFEQVILERIRPVQGFVSLPDSKDRLGFFKQHQKWRLVIQHADGHISLLVSASVKTRLSALKRLPQLVEALDDCIRAFSEFEERVMADARQYLDELESRTAQLVSPA